MAQCRFSLVPLPSEQIIRAKPNVIIYQPESARNIQLTNNPADSYQNRKAVYVLPTLRLSLCFQHNAQSCYVQCPQRPQLGSPATKR